MAIASDKVRRARPLLGTFVEIELAGAGNSKLNTAIDAAFEAVADVHRLMSFHEPGSDVSQLNRDAYHRPVRVHAWTYQVLTAAMDLHSRSRCMFDVAIAPVLQTMRLLPGIEDDLSSPAKLPCFGAIQLLPRQTVRFGYPGMKIDLGGIAKGFAVDRAIELLRDLNPSNGMVNAGGDLAAFGPDPQTIHVRDPRDPRRSICSVNITDEALASTGQWFDLFHSADTADTAIIDPRTQMPVRSVVGATVRAPTCMVADALTKIVMIAGTDASELLEHYQASALLISADGDVQITPDWQHAVHLAA